jgi:hypothetical protein
MSTPLLLGLIPLAFVGGWIWIEIRRVSRWMRIGSGLIAGVSFAFWLVSVSHSLGSYYDGMREHRLLQSLILAYPLKSVAIDAWSSNYGDYEGFDHHVTKRDELEVIIATDR